MSGEEMCDLVESSGVLAESVDDDDGESWFERGEFGVVEADMCDGGVEVWFGDGILILLKLS